MYANSKYTVNYRVTKTFPIEFLEYIYSTASDTIASPLNPSSGPFSVFAINEPFSSLERSFKNNQNLRIKIRKIIISFYQHFSNEMPLPFDQSIKVRLPHV